MSLLLQLVAPTTVLFGACYAWDVSVEGILVEAAFGWDVWGMWTQVVVCCVWWPAWLVGAALPYLTFFGATREVA